MLKYTKLPLFLFLKERNEIMAETLVRIRSVKDYMKEFGIDAIGRKHQDTELVKQQILDAFRREIFEQLALRFDDVTVLARPVDEVDPETKRMADNILRNCMRKWKRLCIEFSKYRETFGLLHMEDLMDSMEDIVNSQQNTIEDDEGLIITEEE